MEKLEEQSSSCCSFDEIVAPLEARQGERLNGWGRRWCEAAWKASPTGFARCVAAALARPSVRSPLGLLVRMIRDGDHLRDAPAMSKRERAPLRSVTECMRCDRYLPVNTVGDELLCDECARDAAA